MQVSPAISQAAQTLRRYGASEVYLFGSRATGRGRKGSDVDMAVKGLPPRQFFRAMAEAQTVLDEPLDLVDLDEPSPFVEYLINSGELQHVG